MKTYRKWPGPVRYIKRKRPDTSGIKIITSDFVERGKAFEIHPDHFFNLGLMRQLEDNVTTVVVHPADYPAYVRQMPTQMWHVRVGAKVKAIRRK